MLYFATDKMIIQLNIAEIIFNKINLFCKNRSLAYFESEAEFLTEKSQNSEERKTSGTFLKCATPKFLYIIILIKNLGFSNLILFQKKYFPYVLFDDCYTCRLIH